jgi:hypothetical protein
MVLMRNAYRILAGITKGKRPIRKLRCRLEDNIKQDIKKVYERVNWIHLAQDRDY